MGGVFISYRRSETADEATALSRDLAQSFGPGQVFIDARRIPLGSPLPETIRDHLASCDALIALIGREWVHVRDRHGRRRLDNVNDYVRVEIATALERKILVIPVCVHGADVPAPEDLPENLAPLVDRLALHLSAISDPHWDFDVGRLVERLRPVVVTADTEKLERLPGRASRRPPAYRATVAELAPTTLAGRDDELAELAAFTTGSEGYYWQVGSPWAGKTALAATLVRTCPDEVDVVAYFLVRRRSDADASRFLQVVNDQLAHLLDERPERLDSPDVFRDLWLRAGQRADELGRHLLLVVDGLDEDLGPSTGSPSVAQLLPTRAGGHTHVLVCSRRYPEIPGDVAADHPLAGVRQVELRPSPLAAQQEERARQDLNHWLGRRSADPLAGDVLALLTAAQGPLSVDDLAGLVSGGKAGVRPRVLRLVEEDIARVLEPLGGEGQLRFAFAHDSLRERAEGVFGLAEVERHRDRFRAWAEDWGSRGWPRETPRYLLDTHPAVLRRFAPERLDALYGDVAYVELAVQVLGADRVAADLRLAAGQTQSLPIDRLRGVVDGEIQHLRPPHPVHERGFVTRQLNLGALRRGADELAASARLRLSDLGTPQLLPEWTTRRTGGELVRALEGHTGGVTAVAINADGTRAVSGGGDHTVRVWDLERGEAVATLRGHTDRVTAVAINDDGIRAVSGSEDRTVRVWDLKRERFEHALSGHTGWVSGVGITADGTRAVSGGDRTVRVWDLGSGEPVMTLRGHTDRVTAVAISADGTRAVSGGEDRTVRAWDLAQGEALAVLKAHAGVVAAVAISGDGTRAVSGGDRTVRVWDLARGEALGALEATGGVTTVAVSRDGTRVVSGGSEGTVQVWDSGSRRAGGPPSQHAGWVNAVAISTDGTRAVSGGEDRSVRVWDLVSGQVLAALEGHRDSVWSVAISADGARAVSGGGDGMVGMWDVVSAKLLNAFYHHPGSVNAVAISADGARAVSGGEKCVLSVWDLARGKELATLQGPDWLTAVAMSADGTRAVSGSSDATVRAWDLEQGKPLAIMKGHVDPVLAVAMSADGTRAVSGGEDRTVRVWDLARGEAVAVLRGHTDSVWAVAVSADGTRAVSGGGDRTIRVWDLETGSCLLVVWHGRVTTLALSGGTREGRLVTGESTGAVSSYLLCR